MIVSANQNKDEIRGNKEKVSHYDRFISYGEIQI